MSNIAHQMKITELESQVQAASTQISRLSNFTEALGITLLDEEDYEEAANMLREALGRAKP